jgi:hypothetical protein
MSRPPGKKTDPAKRLARFLDDPNRVCAEMANTYAKTWYVNDQKHTHEKHTYEEGIEWAIEIYEKYWRDGKGERPDPEKVRDLLYKGRVYPKILWEPERAPPNVG